MKRHSNAAWSFAAKAELHGLIWKSWNTAKLSYKAITLDSLAEIPIPHRMVRLLNYTAVAVFGMGLSIAFCDILWTRRKHLAIAGNMAAILILQGAIYFVSGSSRTSHLYPFITHIPLAIVLCILNKKCLWPVISVLTAYLCCQLRRWIALLAVTVFSGGSMMQNIVELAVTLPLFLVLLHFDNSARNAAAYLMKAIKYKKRYHNKI